MSNLNLILENSEESEENVEDDLRELLKAEMVAVLEEMAPIHANTDEYYNSVKALGMLADVNEKVTKVYRDDRRVDLEEYEIRNKVEQEKIKVEAKDDKKNKLDPNKIFGIVAYGVVMVAFIAIEKEHPPAMRLVQAANALLSPKI